MSLPILITFTQEKKIQNSLSDLRIISYPTMDKNNIIQRIIQVQKKKEKERTKRSVKGVNIKLYV